MSWSAISATASGVGRSSSSSARPCFILRARRVLLSLSLLLLLLLLGCALLPGCDAKLRVHVIGHSHNDAGWLKTVDQYYSGVNRSVNFGVVRQILDSVLLGLTQNPARRFSYGEQAFFQRWYRTLTDDKRRQVQQVVASGQLEFINGGWVQHDEACTHYLDMIDQTTLGHRYIAQQFGEQANPTVGWQIDTFGHSSTHVALLTGEVGFMGLMFARLDYEDLRLRTAARSLEWLWRPSPSLGQQAEVFAYAFAPVQLPPQAGRAGYYGVPNLLCFNLKCYNGDEARPIQDDPELDEYNVPERVDAAVRYATAMAQAVQGEDILLLEGDDWYWEEANHNFAELDKLIHYVNLNGSINMLYSTPSTYIRAKMAEQLQWPHKLDDEMPYGTDPHGYWAGYFSSRPSLKRYVRVNSAALNVARHWEVFAGGNGSSVERLWEALAVVQHHDAVAGTARQAVTDDYSMRLARGWTEADAALQLHLAQVVTSAASAPALSFQSCPLANVSVCPASQQLSAAAGGAAAVLLLYNPLARNRTEVHSVPVHTPGLQVLDAQGLPLPSQQLVSLANSTARMADSAPYELRFTAAVQGLGVETFFIAASSANSADAAQQLPRALHGEDEDGSRGRVAAARQRRGGRSAGSGAAAVVLENACWLLTVDGDTGEWQAAHDKRQNRTFPASLSFLYYQGNASSHYTFGPVGDAVPVSSQSLLSRVDVQGNVTREVQVRVADWLDYTLGLTVDDDCTQAGAVIHLTYSIGPVPIDDHIGKEVIVRYTFPSLSSGSVFYTDSNAREWQQRVRDHRPTWNLTLTSPVSSNYYPLVSGLLLRDEQAGQSMALLTDRANGGSSLQSGQAELLLHRRLVTGLLAGEALDEMQFGRGLVIRGQHSLLLGQAATVGRLSRQLQARLYSPLSASYALLSNASSIAAYRQQHHTSLSFLQAALPVEVELVSLYLRSDGRAVLRLAHSYGVNETDAAPYNDRKGVTVDLSTLFTTSISAVEERSLTDNASKAALQQRRMQWQWRSREEDELHSPHRSDRSRSGLQQGSLNLTILPMEVHTLRVTFA